MRFLRPGSLRLCLALLLLVSGLLAAPPSLLANHDNTCHPPDGPGAHEIEFSVVVAEGPGGPGGLRASTLKVRFTGGGTEPPHVTGTFVLRNAEADQAVTWTAIALAESGGETGATSQCADGDNDSLIGLQSLTVPFRHNQTGETALVTFTPDSEIDASGRYTLTIRGLSDDEFSVEATVRLKGSFGEIDPVR